MVSAKARRLWKLFDTENLGKPIIAYQDTPGVTQAIAMASTPSVLSKRLTNLQYVHSGKRELDLTTNSGPVQALSC